MIYVVLSFFTIDFIPISEYNDNCSIKIFQKEKMRMEFLTTVELSKKWGISSRRIGVLCAEGRIDGVIKKGKTWLIPDYAEKPEDARVKTGKYIKEKVGKQCQL